MVAVQLFPCFLRILLCILLADSVRVCTHEDIIPADGSLPLTCPSQHVSRIEGSRFVFKGPECIRETIGVMSYSCTNEVKEHKNNYYLRVIFILSTLTS